MNIDLREAEIIEEFAQFTDWTERYEHIIDLARELPTLPEALRTDDRLIRGCQSRVWLAARITPNSHVHFTADSDAIITKGLVALMVRVLSDAPAVEIVQAPLNFIDRVGLHEHLSPTRSNGLLAMVQQMKLHALELSAKQNAL